MFPAVSGILSVLIWIYLLWGRGSFWQVSKLKAFPQTGPKNGEHAPCNVAVVVPARNEVDVIDRSITSLLRQDFRGSLHVFLVDDSSQDGTAQAAVRAAEKAGASQSLTVITGEPLPPGWSGKLWAVHQGLEKARERFPLHGGSGDFYLLTDADVVNSRSNVATLVSIADAGGYDLASIMVRLHCESLAEKFLIPAFVFFFFQIYPPSWIAQRKKAVAGAAGGCILIRPKALERAGGIAAIRNEIIDDCALAKAVKTDGGTVWLGLADSDSATSVRPYGTFAEIETMISRTAFRQLNHSALVLIAALAGLVVTYLVPMLLLFSRSPFPIAMGAIAWLMMTCAYLPMIRYYRLNAAWALALPFIALFYSGATLHSAVKFWLGRGGEWKGRVQDRKSAEAETSH